MQPHKIAIKMIAVLAVLIVAVSTAWANNLPVPYDEQDRYIRSLMRAEFGHDPLMEIIVGCESTGNRKKIKHWNQDGTLVKNPTSSASGYAQVLLKYHRDWIRQTGLNMHNPTDYTKFVGIMRKERGYKSWYPSKHCWGKYAHLGTRGK